MRRNIINMRLMWFAFEKTPRNSLNFKLVPVQYEQYEYDFLETETVIISKTVINKIFKSIIDVPM